MMNNIFCPIKTCQLGVKDGKVFCEKHENFLEIKDDWENRTEQIPMHHVLYIAISNGKDGEILIDEEQ